MSDFLNLVKLNGLMSATHGHPELTIGLVDGVIMDSHPALKTANLKMISTPESNGICEVEDSLACIHGTFIAGMLAADRDTPALGICPDCQIISRPIFCEYGADSCPIVTPESLADAVEEVIEAGAHIVNLSVGSDMKLFDKSEKLQRVFDLAQRYGVLVVGAVGNQARLGSVPLFNHPWVIPVMACDVNGQVDPNSNLGIHVGKQGLVAPGVNVVSTAPDGGYHTQRGSSMAVPFVTGALALLWSLYPQATAVVLRRAILLPKKQRTSIIPPLLDVETSWQALNQFI